MIELRIPAVIPSLNRFVNTHWSAYHVHRKEWQRYVWVAKVQARVVGEPKYDRVRLTIERRSARPILDEDNLHAGRKFLQDALVKNGLLLDDNMTVITECQLTQTKVPTREAETVVRIYPIENAPNTG